MLLAIFALYFNYRTPEGLRTFDIMTLLAATGDSTIFSPMLWWRSSWELLFGFLVKMLVPFSTPTSRRSRQGTG